MHSFRTNNANNTNLIISLQNTLKFLVLLLQSLSDTVDSLGLSGGHLLRGRLLHGKSLGDITFKGDEGLEESRRNVAFRRDREATMVTRCRVINRKSLSSSEEARTQSVFLTAF